MFAKYHRIQIGFLLENFVLPLKCPVEIYGFVELRSHGHRRQPSHIQRVTNSRDSAPIGKILKAKVFAGIGQLAIHELSSTEISLWRTLCRRDAILAGSGLLRGYWHVCSLQMRPILWLARFGGFQTYPLSLACLYHLNEGAFGKAHLAVDHGTEHQSIAKLCNNFLLDDLRIDTLQGN